MTRPGRPPIHPDANTRQKAAHDAYRDRNRRNRQAVAEIETAFDGVEIEKLRKAEAVDLLTRIKETVA